MEKAQPRPGWWQHSSLFAKQPLILLLAIIVTALQSPFKPKVADQSCHRCTHETKFSQANHDE